MSAVSWRPASTWSALRQCRYSTRGMCCRISTSRRWRTLRSGLARAVRPSSRCAVWEIADYATVMFDVMGFGKPLDETPLQLQPGLLATAWGSSIRQLAAGLGIDVDEITEAYEREPAPEAFVAAGHIPKGGQAAVRFEIRGMVKAHPAIVIEHVTRSSRCSGAVAVAEAACSGANMGLNTMSLARGG